MDGVTPDTDGEGYQSLFDPQYCAQLHNQIIQHILALQPEFAAHVVRDVFQIPHQDIYLDWSKRDQGIYPNQPPRPATASIDQLQTRLGSSLTTFLQQIDVIVLPYDSWGRLIVRGDGGPETPARMGAPFLPSFGPPALERLFDYATLFQSDDYNYLRNVIQLYPSARFSTYRGGVMFDPFTETAMYMDPDTTLINADQSEWAPLDVVLRAWLNSFEKGRVFVEGEVVKERDYAAGDLNEDVQTWEEYLSVLESKVVATLEPSISSTAISDLQSNRQKQQGLVDSRLFRNASSKSSPITMALLSRLRSPSYGITRIEPGMMCCNNELFCRATGLTMGALEAEADHDQQNYIPQFNSLDSESNSTPTLLFPGIDIDANVLPPCDPIPALMPCIFRGQSPGLYVYADKGSYARLLDHKGNVDIFSYRGNAVPWGRYKSFSLAKMFQAWKDLLQDGTWEVDERGVKGDFGWFDENIGIGRQKRKIWGYMKDIDGDEMEMCNVWVSDYDQALPYRSLSS